jgi:hypothetical protein
VSKETIGQDGKHFGGMKTCSDRSRKKGRAEKFQDMLECYAQLYADGENTVPHQEQICSALEYTLGITQDPSIVLVAPRRDRQEEPCLGLLEAVFNVHQGGITVMPSRDFLNNYLQLLACKEIPTPESHREWEQDIGSRYFLEQNRSFIEELKLIIEAGIRALRHSHQLVIVLRFGLNPKFLGEDLQSIAVSLQEQVGKTKTLRYIGMLLNVSREAIRQQETRALSFLRRSEELKRLARQLASWSEN